MLSITISLIFNTYYSSLDLLPKGFNSPKKKPGEIFDAEVISAW